MANMVDMELDDEETADTVEPYVGKTSGPQYPYGLRICLSDRELKKLKLDMPSETGEMIEFKIQACVKNISSNESDDGHKCQRVELQIEQMAVLE